MDETLSCYLSNDFFDSNSSLELLSESDDNIDEHLVLSSAIDLLEHHFNELKSKVSPSLLILSYLLRSNISKASCKDILNCIKTTYQVTGEKFINYNIMTYERLWDHIVTSLCTEIHYCAECCQLFSSDRDLFKCATVLCIGL